MLPERPVQFLPSAGVTASNDKQVISRLPRLQVLAGPCSLSLSITALQDWGRMSPAPVHLCIFDFSQPTFPEKEQSFNCPQEGHFLKFAGHGGHQVNALGGQNITNAFQQLLWETQRNRRQRFKVCHLQISFCAFHRWCKSKSCLICGA